MDVLFELGSILGLVVGISLVMQVLRLPLMLGYLLAGVLVGPSVFGLLHSAETLEIFSQLGITALLFIVGLGLNPAVIKEVGKAAFFTGMGQILVASLLGFGLARWFGYDPRTAWFLAIGFTFSSTIIVLKLLSDRQDLGKLYGKISIGLLLVQDLVATVVLVGVTTLGHGGETWGTAFHLLAVLVLLLLLLVVCARLILPRLARFFAVSQEFLLVFTVGWGIGIAVLFARFGLSVEIGALAAGVTLASSPYRYEISAKMRLLRDFFLILFFILLGAQLGIEQVGQLWPQAVVFALFILIGNPFIVWVIMGLLGYTKRTTFMVGLTVAQVSEFSLLLLLIVTKTQGVPQSALSLMTMVGVLTIVGSTFLIQYADRLYQVFGPVLSIFERAHPLVEKQRRERYDVFLFGCHRVGTDFLQTLRKRKLTCLVIDFDPQVIAKLEAQRIPCRYGDAYDNELMDELDLSHAKMIICTVPDHETNLFLLAKGKKANASLTMITMAHTVEEARRLYKAGASYVIMPHYLGGNQAALLVEKHGHKSAHFAIERRRHLKHLAERAT